MPTESPKIIQIKPQDNVAVAVHDLEAGVEAAPGLGYSVMGLDYSPVRGPEGNIEYLAYLKKGAFEAPIPDAAEIVAASHRELAK